MKTQIKTQPVKKGVATFVTFTNAAGASVTLCSVGAAIAAVCVPDKDGKLADVVIGYPDAQSYFYDGPCAGKVPGRYANRIAGGHLCVDGKEYQLSINNGPNALHGGPEGFQNQIWDVNVIADGCVEFTYCAKDGEEQYPGNLTAKAKYTWTEENELKLELSATSDALTVVNLTNHAYFNLAGESSGPVLDQLLWLNADKYLPTDPTQIPTGELAPVAGTPMDFTTAHAIGQDIKADFEPLHIGKGYDHCWALNNYQPGKVQLAATLVDPASGRKVEVSTDQPGVQVYTGNWLAGSPVGKGGRSYNDYDAVAIECQDFPDSPNKPAFPSTLLAPGQTYLRHINFKFTLI